MEIPSLVVLIRRLPFPNPSRRRNKTQNPPDADRLGLRRARARLPQAPSAPMVSACARPPTRTPPPTLRDVTLMDLGDVGRLLALHEQARARGWLRGGEAERLNVVAAAVHARRVGQAPCRLFVALLRGRRWEGITQDDEGQARRVLGGHRGGPRPRTGSPAAQARGPPPG